MMGNTITKLQPALKEAGTRVRTRGILAELHADLFSRHTSPLEAYIFVAVDERGQDVSSDEIYRRCNGKQQIIRRRGGRSVQL